MSLRYKKSQRVYVIAEIGINHNGSVAEAKKLIDAAVQAGADSVKFQVRHLPSIYTEQVLKDSLKAEQGTQYILNELHKAHLTFDDIRELKEYSSRYDVDFFATPFDHTSLEFLISIGTEIFKIGSPDFTNLPLIAAVAKTGCPVILSTGMSDEAEILKVVRFLKEANADFSLLHCNSTYPASLTDINLRYIPKLKALAGVRVGYSGHERGFAPTLAAVALGAEIVERHITFNKEGDGPDHSSSLMPEEFREMVESIREIELSLGKDQRVSNQGEQVNRITLAKCLVAATDLAAGTILENKHIEARTPAKGVSPLDLPLFIGKKLLRPLKKHEYIRHEDVLGVESRAPEYKISKTWGVVGRLNDFDEFLDIRPDLVEIHLTWRDLVSFNKALVGEKPSYPQDLVVHAPEYYQDELIDFTSDDPNVTEASLEMLQKTIHLARELAPRFQGQKDPRGPRVVVHPGGHFQKQIETDKTTQYRLLMKNLRSIDTEGVRILVENMPPFPWYFGGQWYNTVFLDAKEIAQFAREMGWGVCYDTSHALLYCNHAGISLRDFTKDILDHVQYLHISDAKGTTQEGMQLGAGDLDFDHLFELLHRLDVGFIPEIWQGHLNRGAGFKQALGTIERLLKEKMSGSSCSVHGPSCAGNHI